MTTEVSIRVYGSLNDFLPAGRRQTTSTLTVQGHPAVKDVVEAFGPPHPEIDLVLINGAPAPFDRAVQHGDRIAVFPRFRTLDVGGVTEVRVGPLDPVRFVADVHLGALARRLRLAGLDTAYRNDATDPELAELSAREGRVLLTRDQGLLKRRAVAHGCFVRETRPHRQMVEILRRYGPLPLLPFSRCPRCNGALRAVARSAVERLLPPRTRERLQRFWQCADCGHVYWRGAHWARLVHALETARREAETG